MLSESRLDTPAGTVASEYFSALGCGKEKSYISLPDDIGGAVANVYIPILLGRVVDAVVSDDGELRGLAWIGAHQAGRSGP